MPYSDPDKARNYQRDYRRVQREGQGCTRACTTQVSPAFRAETYKEVLALLADQVEAVRADKKIKTTEKARTIGYLANIVLKALDIGDLYDRVVALESVLKQRNGESKR